MSETSADVVGRESRGVLYIASGEKYVRTAVRSALTVRNHCPDLAIHLFSGSGQSDETRNAGSSPFTSVAPIDHPHRRSKVDCLALTPFDRTLYLDSDTEVCDDIGEVFELFDRFDVALAHAHRRNHPDTLQIWRSPIPASFPQFNGGVIAYRRTDSVMSVLRAWQSAYHEASFPKDQVTLRELLWHSDLRIATLPPEYNIRYRKYC